jgi:hypothetical protein
LRLTITRSFSKKLPPRSSTPYIQYGLSLPQL